MEGKGRRRLRKFYAGVGYGFAGRRAASRAGARAAICWAGLVLFWRRGKVLSQRHFRLCCGNRGKQQSVPPRYPRKRTTPHCLAGPHASATAGRTLLSPYHIRPPSMDSESEHEHRDVNDVESESENEELEETKPKSALKKPREAPVHVERPELP